MAHLKKILLYFTISSLFSGNLFSQNLVPNPSFESSFCPTTGGQLDSIPFWYSPTCGSTDYFAPCAIASSKRVPNNNFGSEAARTGLSYAGAFAWSSATTKTEYLQSPLTSPLEAGETYIVTFYVSRADNYRHSVRNIGAYLSIGPATNYVCPLASPQFLTYTPQVYLPTYAQAKAGWKKIQGTFIATGGEDYITLGVFSGPATTDVTATDPLGSPPWDGSYYYYEDVSVVKIIPLPIKLIEFNADYSTEKVLLNWITASEINNDYFEIERSSDANNWEHIAKINGAGNSNQTINYIYVDINPLNTNTSYYRLKQVDYNGNFSYSIIIPVKQNIINDSNPIIIYNPFSQSIKIEFTYSDNVSMQLYLFDSFGSLIKSLQKPIIKGINQINIPSSQLHKGIYFIKTTLSDGNVIKSSPVGIF